MKDTLFKILKMISKLFIGTGISKISVIRHLYYQIFDTLTSKNPILIQVFENEMYVNPKDKGIALSLLLKGQYEDYETQLFRQLIQQEMVVLDIGANIGYYTLIAANSVGESGKVYAFEPDPDNYNLLSKNIEINKYDNIIPVKKALSNTTGDTKLFLHDENYGMRSFSDKNVNSDTFRFVNTITLDDYWEREGDNQQVDLIKIDVEGAEGLVFEGAKKILAANKPIIIMEFIPSYLKNLGAEPEKFLSDFYKIGYHVKIIDEKKKLLVPMTINELIEFSLTKEDGKNKMNILLSCLPVNSAQ